MQNKRTPKQTKVSFSGFVFFHPDYTVGFGLSPNLRVYKYIQARGLIRSLDCKAQLTTGGELHPALKRCALIIASFLRGKGTIYEMDRSIEI